MPVLCSFFQCKFLFLFSRFLEIYKVKGKPITREGLVKPSCLRLLYSLRILNTETLYKEQTVKRKIKLYDHDKLFLYNSKYFQNMSKRSSVSGDSPGAKNIFGSQASSSSMSTPQDSNFDFTLDSDPPDPYTYPKDFILSSSPDIFPSVVLPPSSPTDFSPDMLDFLNRSNSTSSDDTPPSLPKFESADSPITLDEAIIQSKESKGISITAQTILDHADLKEEILKVLYKESHHSIKDNLKKSRLCANKNDRRFLLSLSPKTLCQEFQQNSPRAFFHLVQGILGISDPESVFENQFLLNNICLVYSTLSKVINRKAVSYALLLTTAARDGGMREDSIKLFPMLVHPRTSQKYDKDTLAKDWDKPLTETLQAERAHFEAINEALKKKADLEEVSDADFEEITTTINKLLETVPKQVQCVWDNLNLRTKHRFQRQEDDYSQNNFDWMASLFIKDRIDASHMDSTKPLKTADDLKIEDYVPTVAEKNYVFQSLVCYFSSRLVDRCPLAFKELNSSIRPNKDHQFQAEMDSKSEEFTGELFTKSEGNTEDLISMMKSIQSKYVHIFEGPGGSDRCFERKILSGDNKTEKNQVYGILSKIDESSDSERLGYLLPQHEFFHQMMVMADCESEIVRDNSRGLDGGSFFRQLC